MTRQFGTPSTRKEWEKALCVYDFKRVVVVSPSSMAKYEFELNCSTIPPASNAGDGMGLSTSDKRNASTLVPETRQNSNTVAASGSVSTASAPHPEPKPIVREESGTGWIGVTTIDDSVKGVVITRVLAGSPADQAGLQAGDAIEKMDGVAVISGMKFDVAIAHSKPGSQVRLNCRRGAWKSEVTLTVTKIG